MKRRSALALLGASDVYGVPVALGRIDRGRTVVAPARPASE